MAAVSGSSVDQPWTKSAELAELFLRACAAGAPCADLAAALAESVLEDKAVRLADLRIGEREMGACG